MFKSEWLSLFKVYLSKFPLFQGRDVSLEEFPSLLAMEGHTGGFGFTFTAIWAVYAGFTIREAGPWERLITPSYILGILLACFFFLSWLSFILTTRYTEFVGSHTNGSDSWDQREYWARFWILSLSMCYVVLCASLIWLTGGVHSPFLTFYVMIFTLTIPKIKVRKRGVLALSFFVLAVSIACAAAWLGKTPISTADMRLIQNSRFQFMMYLFFLWASMGVPTFSAYRIKKIRSKQREIKNLR